MALVLMATHGWGTLFVDPADLEAGVGQQSSFTIPVTGTAATHYADSAGGSPSTGPVTADANGRLVRWIEEGTYTQTLPGGETLEVQAVSGATVASFGSDMASLRTRVDQVAGPWALSANGTWTWFTNPRAVCYGGTYRRLYAGYVRAGGDVCIASYDLDTAVIEEFVLHSAMEQDDHDNPSVYVRPDGRIVAFYCKHGTDGNMLWRISTNAESVSAWGSEQTLAMTSVTYSNPHYLSSEAKLYLFTRSVGPLGFGDGARCPTMIRSTDGAVTFDTPAPIFQSGSGTEFRPYVQYASDGVSRIHFIASHGHPRDTVAGDGDLYHWYYEAGNLYKSDGTLIRTVASLTSTGPLGPSEVTKVYDATTDKGLADNGNAWPWSIELDATGKPVITYAVFSAVDDNRYQWARWTGSAWSRKQLLTGVQSVRNPGDIGESQYAGGIHLDPLDTNTVYLSRITLDQWEIEKWVTADNGATWTPTVVTADSTVKNLRPYVPRNRLQGCPELLWLRGRYDSWSAGEFDTDVYASPGQLVTPPVSAPNADVQIKTALNTTQSLPDLTINSFYGIDATGPYYDPGAVVQSEAAYLAVDPTTGAISLTLIAPLASISDLSYAQLNQISIDVRSKGAIGDGGLHPLSARFATLAAAKAIYPFVTALTQEQDWAGIQSACDQGRIDGRPVHIPAGDYTIDQYILLEDYNYIYGDGWRTQILEKGGANDGLPYRMFEPRGHLTRTTTGVVIRDLRLNGQSELQHSGGPLTVPSNTHIGISFRNGEFCKAINVLCENFDGDGIHTGRDTAAIPVTGGRYNTFESCYVRNNVRNGMMIQCGDNNLVKNNVFEANQVGMKHDSPKYAPNIYASAEIDLEPNVAADHCDYNIVEGNTFKNGYWAGLQISRPSPTENNNIIRNNTFLNMRSDYMHGQGNKCAGTLLEGNTFWATIAPLTGTVDITNGSNVLANVAVTGIQNGMRIIGAGIPVTTVVLFVGGVWTMVSNDGALGHSNRLATATTASLAVTCTFQPTRFLRFTEGNDTRIVRNTFRGIVFCENSSNAVEVVDAGGSRPQRLEISGNTFDFTGATGAGLLVNITNCDDVVLGGNTYIGGATLGRTGTVTVRDSGVATLVAGTVVVAAPSVTANTRIHISRQTDGGTVGAGYSHTRVAGTGFTIQSKDGAGANQAADTSVVAWRLFEGLP